MRLLKIVPDNTNIGFVKLRGIAFGLTLLLTIAAGALVGIKGLNFGVDFVGGVSIESKFDGPAPLGPMREIIDGLGVGEGQLQPFGDGSTVDVRLPLPNSTDEGASNAMVAKVEAALKAKFPSVQFNQVSTVSGKVSDELIWKGTLAVVVAITCIALFGIVRFEWQFGVATFVSIFHDVLMTLGFFALTRMEFDLNIVAAVLTIIGYSINDKIVIDDRIRENLRKYRQMPLGELIDLSVNETLPRTVMTSLTILLALLSLLLFGGHVLRGFTAAMMLGVVVGTYSSIYVSSSLLITLGLDTARQRQMVEASEKKGGKKAAREGAERIAPKKG
jgi:preprotein translocase subunit SecF